MHFVYLRNSFLCNIERAIVPQCNAVTVYVQDWYSSHDGPPHVYVGAYRLEDDLSWTPEVSVAVRTKQMSLVNDLFIDKDTQLTKSSDLGHNTSDIEMQLNFGME
jgi:Protein of unknown function (DUF2452).